LKTQYQIAYFKYPAPTVAGFTSTLATTADVAAGSGSTINTAFTQKTFAAAMSVCTILLILTFVNITTGNFSLAVTGTVNGDSGIVNLVFGYVEGGGPAPIVVQTATLLANFIKKLQVLAR
jgi:hypothetical protein